MHKKHVTDFQGIRWIAADLCTNLEAAELLRNKAATMEENGDDSSCLSSMAKLYCGQAAAETIMAAIRIAGSYGCYRDKPFERWLRDVKALEIAGGTPEIMKNIIANQILPKLSVSNFKKVTIFLLNEFNRFIILRRLP